MIFREYYVFIYQDKDSMDLWSYNVDGKILQCPHLCVSWSIRMEANYPQCHHSYRPPYAIHLARRIQVILRWETQKKLSLVQSVIFLPISHKTRSSFLLLISHTSFSFYYYHFSNRTLSQRGGKKRSFLSIVFAKLGLNGTRRAGKKKVTRARSPDCPFLISTYIHRH